MAGLPGQSQYEGVYPNPPASSEATALLAHVLLYGDPPVGWYYHAEEVIPWWIPQPVNFWQVTMRSLMPLYRTVVTWELPAGADNLAVTTHDWRLNSASPATADWQHIESRFQAFGTGLSDTTNSGSKITGIRWYEMADNGDGPGDESFRYTMTNYVAGNGTGMLPPQVSCAVSEVTNRRRSWGRFYVPWIANTAAPGGRLSNAACGIIAGAAATLLATASNWEPIVYSKKAPYALPVLQVRVDNVPDIIRTRRWRAATYRATEDL